MKPVINLKPLFHRGAEQIGLYFKNNTRLNILIRSKAGGSWSHSNKCWYIPSSRQAVDKLKTALHDEAVLEIGELKKHLEEKKKKSSPSRALPKTNTTPIKITTSSPLKPHARVAAVNKHVLPAMEELLKLKAFSPSTIRTYINEMAQLLQTLQDIPADELTPALLKRYLVYCYEKLGLKENTLHSRINALYPVGFKN